MVDCERDFFFVVLSYPASFPTGIKQIVCVCVCVRARTCVSAHKIYRMKVWEICMQDAAICKGGIHVYPTCTSFWGAMFHFKQLPTHLCLHKPSLASRELQPRFAPCC